jgi:hypothetical protein
MLVRDQRPHSGVLEVIHYHGLPMTPQADMVKSFAGRHAMVSYEHADQIELAAEICQSIVLDNGAFSAWRADRIHDFAGYKEWCRKWFKHPAVDWCVIPDVIDGAEHDNDLLIADWLLGGQWRPGMHRSVPVYHLHESIGRLETLANAYPRIALGSSGIYAEPGSEKWWGRMAEIMKILCDSDGMPKVRLHGLRMLDPVIFSHIPFSSVDSCNVARNVGIDQAWNGPYAPRSRAMRALILMDRIEGHAAASRWSSSAGVQHNMELVG